MERSKKDAVLFIKAEEALALRLKRAAELLDVSLSRLIRETLREKLDQLSWQFPELSRTHKPIPEPARPPEAIAS